MSFRATLGRVFREFSAMNPARHGAALAYYGTFSLVPILAIGYEFLMRLLRDRGAEVLVQFQGRIAAYVGPEVVTMLRAQVEAASRRTEAESTWISLIGFLALLYAASGAFTQLKYSLNSIWGIPYASQLATIRQVLTRLLGMLLVLGTGVLLVVAVVLALLLEGLSITLDLGPALPGIDALLTLLLASLMFAVIYKALPDAPVRWIHALVGGAVSASLILAALLLVTLFFRSVEWEPAARIGGGVAVILIGINYMAQTFLLGAVLVRLMGAEASRP